MRKALKYKVDYAYDKAVQFKIDILSYSGPSGILGSDRKENTA